MITITAHFKGNGLSNLLKALDRIEAAAASQAENLPEAGSVAMKNHLADAVASAGDYAPYNERYRDWKRDVFGSTEGFWLLSGDLYTALVSRHLGLNRWLGGFAAGIYDQGNKSYRGGRRREIVWYLKILEHGGTFSTQGGTQTHPARPLVGPAQTQFATTAWPGMQIKSLGTVVLTWRR